MTRSSIRHNVLFRRYPEYKNLDIKDGGNEEDRLERLDRFAFDGFLLDCLDDRRIVASQPESTSCPFFVPQYEGMEDCKHLFPIDVLPTMTRGDSFGENAAIVNPSDALGAAGVGRCVMVDTR